VITSSEKKKKRKHKTAVLNLHLHYRDYPSFFPCNYNTITSHLIVLISSQHPRIHIDKGRVVYTHRSMTPFDTLSEY
jgi:hypothetical protein